MDHPSRQQRWISYSLALLLVIALSWGLTQPALAAPVPTQTIVGTLSPSNLNPNTPLLVGFAVASGGVSAPITGSVSVNTSWGGSCSQTLDVNDNRLGSSGYVASSSCVLSPLVVGVHTITARYNGDSNNLSSTSSSREITVKYLVDVAITAHTPDPAGVDQAVLVQYSITPLSADSGIPAPTGTVFVTDGVNSCLSTPATGQCSLLLETAGIRTLTASYSGDSNFYADSGAVNHTVIGYASTTRIKANTPDPSIQGQAVSVSYSVVANDPSKGIPSGVVTVSDGVDSCTGTVAAGSCSLTLSTPGARTLSATYAGNTKFAGSISAAEPHTVNVLDTTPPVITVSGTKADGSPYTTGTWTNQNVLVHFTCSDRGSGIAVCPGDQVISPNGTFTAEGTATDNAGNTASASFGPIQIDKTAPTVTVSGTKADGSLYTVGTWTNQNVLVHFTCSDIGSGIAVCPGDQVISPDGTFTAAGTARDNAGNTASASFGPMQIDKTAPSVAVTGVSNGGGYLLGAVPTAGCTTTDALSGVAIQATLSFSGGNGDGTGDFTATCSGGRDNAGNQAAASVNFTVNAPPTATNTPLPTATNTPLPTATNTPLPTATNTPLPTATPTSSGLLIGSCGPYTVYQVGSNYTAAGWNGTIKVGTSGNNTLTGGNGPDLLLGLGGNDLLQGNGGDDLLCGGDGVDLLQGLAGNDLLDGGDGHDVLNGGSGDYDELLAGEGNDVLLDGDGVRNASGGAGSDLFTLALRYGWRDGDGQARFAGLTAGYGNDVVGLAILNPVRFFVDISGDERNTPASPLEGNDDGLALVGVIDPASPLIKFEHRVVLSADTTVEIPGEEDGAEYLTEPVGEEGTTPVAPANRLFLPFITR